MGLTSTETLAAPAAAGPRSTASVPKVIGLDVAMSITGIAGEGWTDYVRAKGASQHSRFEQQLAGIADHTRHAALVVIEGAAYGHNNQGADALAAMRWMVRHALWKRRIPYAVVTPGQRMIYAVGTAAPTDPETGKRLKGTGLKAILRQAVAETYGITTEGPARYDEADAYVLMAMGLHWLGYPLAVVADDRRRALDSVRWPDREAVTAR
ncbi:hypothetical protein C9F11_37615 [Streptomyces sp. YIM 121038]|uniref:hypothetical protein n=1 Tax=Streptomyces sp. YIM 121038 TaxID=2136401 RepID=UPI001164CB7E|nr:hypothetical protein [Streptomyces sp. YIM 121038]QCX81106.1 hypothetical protein C9F11_37615 [Streptomyces sp. YIM 121038]